MMIRDHDAVEAITGRPDSRITKGHHG